MDIIKAHEAYKATKERLKDIEKIEDFLQTEEYGLVVGQIKNRIQAGSFVAVLDKEHFCWNYEMIYKCFTHLGYKVKKDESGDIIISWRVKDKA